MPHQPSDTFPIADGSPERTISQVELEQHLEYLVENWIVKPNVQRLLLLPPDHTRLFSLAGPITAWLYRRLGQQMTVDVMPALGTHKAMSAEKCETMASRFFLVFRTASLPVEGL